MNRANVDKIAAVYGVERREPASAVTADGLRVVRDDGGALVVAADLGAGGPSLEFWAARAQELAARTDRALLGACVLRDGRRVPPREWPPMRIVWELGHRQRGAEVGSLGVRSWWPDPLSFIGAAANGETS